jgi:uncharacterized protein YndB with AHSA1/START domain
MPRVTQPIASAPDDVFDLFTSPTRLPEWNRIVVRVVDTPERLTTGDQWVVQLKALGQSWLSRSTVRELDRAERRFVYRSQTDDGNPSYADWSWRVTEAPGGCSVSVAFSLHPATFWRRALLAKIRGRQLARHELPESLRMLALHSVRAPNA